MSNSAIIDMELRIMRAAVEDLIEAGFLLSVCVEDDYLIKDSNIVERVLDAMRQADEEILWARKPEQKEATKFVFFVYGNDGYDVICDYSMSLESYLKRANDVGDELMAQVNE